ncbi:T5SS/PEP-CTERM-associated repeat-containing protein [Burkholderia sp. CF099]|nr:T5SS/PEP-CTERM-associated repeat-containing protein [Burkholderia sp. CF099]
MTIFKWTGSAGTGVFATAGNWDLTAAAPPGPSDVAIIVDATKPITGTGTARVLNFGGTNEVKGHLTATYGCPVNEKLTLLPGSVLTTPKLHIGLDFDPNPPTTDTAIVTVDDSRVVISGCNPPDTFAISIARIAGNRGTLVVQGANAVVNGDNQPMSVGQDGTGALTIRQGAVVSVGNGDPLKYPWALVIGNHPGSKGTPPSPDTPPSHGIVDVSHALLQAHGQVIVGRYSVGELHLHERGLVFAEDVAIGWAPDSGKSDQGNGMVTVKGDGARLIVDNSIEVGHFGVGSLTVEHHGFVSAGVGIIVNGALSLANGIVNSLAIGIYAGGTLSGSGTVIAVQGFNNDGGTITADGKLILVGDIDNPAADSDVPMVIVTANGELQCFGALTDNGKVSLRDHSVASLEAVDENQTIAFDGQHATLVLRSPGAFAGTISGFKRHDKIVVEADVAGIVAAPGLLTVNGPGSTVIAQLQIAGGNPGFSLVAPGFPGVITA